MQSIVVLQARTNSSRLPAKVLLPINGIPLVVLAAKRAGNTGREVIVTTSNERYDDNLVSILESYRLRYFRGSLDDPLERITTALAGYGDQTIVFRLTADNVLPDGFLLDELEFEFIEKKLNYLCCNGAPSGVPYGVSIEVTFLAHLREAASFTSDTYDREHVTPFVINKFGQTYFQKYLKLRKGHLRCTIDCLDDYLTAVNIFTSVSDPIKIPFLSLLSRLESAPFQPISCNLVPNLILGTAQLNDNYGITNINGKPTLKNCKEIIKTAIANGVVYIDTARAYGDSESMIGNALNDGWKSRVKVITKLSPLYNCPRETTKEALNSFVDTSIFQSCTFLRTDKLDIVMIHRAGHLHEWNGWVWQRLLELKCSGIIAELGVSVQNPDELNAALLIPHITYIQLPFNLLDWRWDGVISKIRLIKKTRKLNIHVRSSLLQGLLLSPNELHWTKANVAYSLPVRKWLHSQVSACKRLDLADLCYSFVNAMDWVDGVTLGVENLNQLIENIKKFGLGPLSGDYVEAIRNTRPKLHVETLDPSLWQK